MQQWRRVLPMVAAAPLMPKVVPQAPWQRPPPPQANRLHAWNSGWQAPVWGCRRGRFAFCMDESQAAGHTVVSQLCTRPSGGGVHGVTVVRGVAAATSDTATCGAAAYAAAAGACDAAWSAGPWDASSATTSST